MRVFAGVAVSLLLIGSCSPLENVVGSPDDTLIPSMAFTVDRTYLDNNAMVAEGMVRNNSNSTVSPPWYVEAQFYTDSTYVTKVGGNYTQISVPLSPGQQTFWRVSFSSTNVNVMQFPHFRVGNLRAVYKD